jgi:pantetheine-phosphate adenylyltransferase
MILIYPGSFDPVTAGHISVVRRAAKFAKIIVAVLDNPNKKTLFTVRERISFLREALDAEVESFSGLLADYAARKNADGILRGLRNAEDFTTENKYAAYNAAISQTFGKRVETVFLPSTPELSHVSSNIVKEAAAHIYENNLDDSFIAEIVPPSVRAALRNKFER